MSIIDSIKSSLFVSIHPAGMPFIVIFSVVTVLLGWIWSPLFLIGIIITICSCYFIGDVEINTNFEFNNQKDDQIKSDL